MAHKFQEAVRHRCIYILFTHSLMWSHLNNEMVQYDRGLKAWIHLKTTPLTFRVYAASLNAFLFY